MWTLQASGTEKIVKLTKQIWWSKPGSARTGPSRDRLNHGRMDETRKTKTAMTRILNAQNPAIIHTGMLPGNTREAVCETVCIMYAWKMTERSVCENTDDKNENSDHVDKCDKDVKSERATTCQQSAGLGPKHLQANTRKQKARSFKVNVNEHKCADIVD